MQTVQTLIRRRVSGSALIANVPLWDARRKWVKEIHLTSLWMVKKLLDRSQTV